MAEYERKENGILNTLEISPLNAVLAEKCESAEWKYEKIQEQIHNFEKNLDSEHEIALKLAAFGSSITMMVTEISYQNPDLLYFYGFVNGAESQLIQHMNQLNFLLTSVERKDKTKPARRIGFTRPDSDYS